jgi:hypothetical protein
VGRSAPEKVQKLLRGWREVEMFALFQGSGNKGVDPREMDVSVFYEIKAVLLKVEDEKPHSEQGVKVIIRSVWSGGPFEDGRQIVNGEMIVVHPDML